MALSQLILSNGLRLSDLNETPELDVAIDGADEVDPALNCIKGGGACQTQEKLVAAAAAQFVIVADYRKRSRELGTEWAKGVPIEVLPIAHECVSRRLRALGGAPTLRMAVAKAGPVVTDNGGFVLDCVFGAGALAKPSKLSDTIKLLPGVLEVGLFCGMAQRAYFGEKDGTVMVVERPPR